METSAQTPEGENLNSPRDCPEEAKDDHSDASSSGIFSQEDLSSLAQAQQSQVDQDYQAKLQQSLANFTRDDVKESTETSTDFANRDDERETKVAGASVAECADRRERSEMSDEVSTTESEESSLSSNAEEQLKNFKKKPIHESLSDVARFAYCSLVAVCLPNLFENQWNKYVISRSILKSAQRLIFIELY